MNEEILEITKKFHDTYEKLANEYTYETREDTKVFDINSNNGKLMYATVNEIVNPILKENQELKKQVEELKFDIVEGKPYIKLDTVITKQQKFINYLEDKISKQKNDIFANALISEDIDLYIMKIKLQELEEILQKYKEIIGDDK